MTVYTADLTSLEAWQLLTDEPDARLIDVRTEAELSYVGAPDLTPIDRTVVRLLWAPPGKDFAARVDHLFDRPDRPLLLLCRSGTRSAAAATLLSQSGRSRVYNVVDGFEGPINDDGHRGVTSGWKASGLPWRQT